MAKMMTKISKFQVQNRQALTMPLPCHVSLASPQSCEHWPRTLEPQPLREAPGGGLLMMALKTSPWEMEVVPSYVPAKEIS